MKCWWQNAYNKSIERDIASLCPSCRSLGIKGEDMMKSALLIATAIFIAGCMSHNVQLYGVIDQSNKTVTVPIGSKGLKGALKKSLSQKGWKLVVYRGPSVTEGELGRKTKLAQYDTFNTKYRLIVSSRVYDLCLDGSPAINYEVSFIDNYSGEEVFTIGSLEKPTGFC